MDLYNFRLAASDAPDNYKPAISMHFAFFSKIRDPRSITNIYV